MSGIGERKLSHLELCATRDVESHASTLLDEVHLLHEALPELSAAEVDPSVELLGRRLHAPILISGMTGGAPAAREVNRALATAAQKLGLGMGVGSQRAMLVDPACADSYRVRDAAPDILLLANIGAVQAREAGPSRVAALVEDIGADALCVHLNPAQELVQDEGDRDFRGCVRAIERLVRELRGRVVVKETGCGLGPAALARLGEVGVATVDVSGAGGTTWTGVEALRGSARQRALGQELREWGIPTAAAIVYARRAGMRVIASGGLRGALDVVRALALGADAASLALPFLRAYAQGGERGVLELAERIAEGVRALLLLTGARRPEALRSLPRRLGSRLRSWVEDGPATAGAAAARHAN
ncbi:MAG TPA: type 2 isopentenyl-diphosphate Delta-isomerase [Myxococcota bacterium]|nr:type 2 isopentenyl-diphosphate Delta-isomerase [Myxococcota bacterium]